MNIQPTEDRVIIRRVEAPTATPGGIILPDIAKKRSQRGTVLAVGPGKQVGIDEVESYLSANDSPRLLAMSIEVGDHVLYSSYAGSEIEVEGETLLIMREGEVLGVVGGTTD